MFRPVRLAAAAAVLASALTLPAAAHAGRPGANGLIAAAAGMSDALVNPQPIDLLLLAADGSERARLRTSTPPAPTWSSDGTTLLFRNFVCTEPGPIDVACAGGEYTLQATDAALGSPHAVTQATPDFDFRSPAFAPTGTAFVMAAPDGVWYTDRPGGSAHRLSTDTTVRALSWSPDGRRIVFSSERTGTGQLFTMASDGTDVRQLTFGALPASNPAWSPDGTRILYSLGESSGAWSDPIGHLWTIRPDGTDARRLHYEATDDPIRGERFGAWSPDGTMIAVSRWTQPAYHELWVMNADGSDFHLLRAGAGDDVDWQRLNRPPAASFTYAPAAPFSGEAITLTSTSSDPDGPLTATRWDLDGDGTYETTAEHPVIVLPSPDARQEVAVQVADQDGAVAQLRQAIVAGNRPPVAGLVSAPASPRTGDRVTFTSTSSDPEGRLAATRWDLDGDGAYDDASGATASWTFTMPGAHVVRVRAEDADGAVAVASATVVVTEPRTGPTPLLVRSAHVVADRLAHALRHGLGVRIALRARATIVAVARLSAAAQRRTGLHGIVAHARVTRPAGSATFRLTSTAGAKRRLRHAAPVTVVVTLGLHAGDGRAQVVRRTVRLR